MTGCSIDEIAKVLNSLGNVVKDKFSDRFRKEIREKHKNVDKI